MQDSIADSFTNFLRKASKVHCPVDGCVEEVPDSENQIRAHLTQRHPELVEDQDVAVLVREFKKPAPAFIRTYVIHTVVCCVFLILPADSPQTPVSRRH